CPSATESRAFSRSAATRFSAGLPTTAPGLFAGSKSNHPGGGCRTDGRGRATRSRPYTSGDRSTSQGVVRTSPANVATTLVNHIRTSPHDRRWRYHPGACGCRRGRDSAPPGASACSDRATGAAPGAPTAPASAPPVGSRGELRPPLPAAAPPPVGSRGVLRPVLPVHGLRSALHPPDAASGALCHVLPDRDTG